ncbi:hypothetical protein PHYSODRAFT_330001 [Phytophthora sojae]|uniref:Uncharacterized protein n=1 Tax=Phytophthora sojae (strain P6497) TaxID=1094619 RepID=G4ZCC4_PHYSP|nr:hypothetical protein PHYSODRAFT_330001 [Phytophthora sojae]EGZ22152.1 hypothetical protein PHYSODRAFT_330001 [Phytophthora sojae]|eukprot:XP_009524869.1 hypothetical protein PHYSODRAFT_330001 [Phytophthora sojae]
MPGHGYRSFWADSTANGHAEVLEALLDKLVKPPSEPDSDTWEALQYALMAAGEHEHLAVLQLLVTCFLAASSTHKMEDAASTVTLVLEDAAAHGKLAVVDFLVTHAAPLLVEFVDPSEESPALAAAIMWTSRGAGLNDLGDRIYDVYPLRRHERTGLLLELAVDDSVDAVRYILDKGVDLYLVNKAFKKAAKAGAVAVVQFLWTSFEISPEYLDEVFKKTAISAGKAIQMKQVSDDATVAAFEHAVAVDFRDKFAILELLHKRECISPQVLTDVLVVAATQGNSAFVDLVRSDSRILSETLDKAFVESVFSENGNQMKGLFDSQLVSPAAICVAFVIAAARNQLQTATALANYLSVESYAPRHFKDVAFVFVADSTGATTTHRGAEPKWKRRVVAERAATSLGGRE